MDLPNFFLADQPPEATLNASIIIEACHTLKRNRGRYLAERSTESMIRVLSDLAKSWLQPDNRFRMHVLERGPETTGFSEATIATGLDHFFSQLTEKNLEALILQELGHTHRLDKFSANYLEEQADRSAWVRGPELLVHIAGGVLPTPVIMSIISGLLVRSAQFVKCASGTSFIPRMFAHSLYEVEPKLGASLEIAEWRGGTAELENALFAEADFVTATGCDETLQKIKGKLPQKTRFLGYGHRVSFGYVAHEVLSGVSAQKTAAKAARDVIAWNQLGCLSPHVFYVETGGAVSPEKFAELLASELEKCEREQPRGKISTEDAGAISYRRSFYEVRATSTETRLWHSENSTAWTVIYENEPRFQMSCLNRFVYVKAISDVTQALQGVDLLHGKISTVGLAATGSKAQIIAKQLANWGVTRICPLGQMQNPPITWRHDGRPALGDLVTWSDWEF